MVVFSTKLRILAKYIYVITYGIEAAFDPNMM